METACGVICELNPLHNGHAWLLQNARAQSGADAVICAMSGSFTQRGEPTLVDKWLRTRMALCAGADLVLELPTLFAVRAAPHFARGGVALLDALGVCTHLCFGSETDDLDALSRAAAQCFDEDAPFQAQLREGLAQGQTLARARHAALQAVCKNADALAQPNAALALEYLQALMRMQSAMRPIVVQRIGAGYHDGTLQPFASATAIRTAVHAGNLEQVQQAVPAPVFLLLRQALAAGAAHQPAALDIALLAMLRMCTAAHLRSIADIGEGLEHRILRLSHEVGTRDALLCALKCKRYTHAHLSRVLTQALLGMTRVHAESCAVPTYARVLGIRAGAEPLLRAIKRRARIPLLTSIGREDVMRHPTLALDLRATDLWALGCATPSERAGARDFTQRFIVEG